MTVVGKHRAQQGRIEQQRPRPATGPWDAPTAAFLADVRMYASMRADGPSHRFYEQMKAQARSTLPHLSSSQWARLMDEVARICGV